MKITVQDDAVDDHEEKNISSRYVSAFNQTTYITVECGGDILQILLICSISDFK